VHGSFDFVKKEEKLELKPRLGDCGNRQIRRGFERNLCEIVL